MVASYTSGSCIKWRRGPSVCASIVEELYLLSRWSLPLHRHPRRRNQEHAETERRRRVEELRRLREDVKGGPIGRRHSTQPSIPEEGGEPEAAQ